MALRYGAFGRIENVCLTIRDSRGTVLSLPPILNGRTGGEARVGDRILLLESTGTRERAVREALGLLLVVFVSRGWSVAPVALHRDGHVTSDGRSVFAPRAVDLPAETLRALSGTAYPPGEVERRLGRVRLRAHPHAGGWRVDVPPWRPDLLTAVDLAEDVILAEAVAPAEGIVPPSLTRGRRRPETVFRRRIATTLLGLGLAAPYTSMLVSESTVRTDPRSGPDPAREPALGRVRLRTGPSPPIARRSPGPQHPTRLPTDVRGGGTGRRPGPDGRDRRRDTLPRGRDHRAGERRDSPTPRPWSITCLRTVDIGVGPRTHPSSQGRSPGALPGFGSREKWSGEVGEVHPEVLAEHRRAGPGRLGRARPHRASSRCWARRDTD